MSKETDNQTNTTHGSAVERLAALLDMSAKDVEEAARNIARKRMYESLMEKVRLIREMNTAILPTGEIVDRGTPGSLPYDSPQNAEPTSIQVPRLVSQDVICVVCGAVTGLTADDLNECDPVCSEQCSEQRIATLKG